MSEEEDSRTEPMEEDEDEAEEESTPSARGALSGLPSRSSRFLLKDPPPQDASTVQDPSTNTGLTIDDDDDDDDGDDDVDDDETVPEEGEDDAEEYLPTKSRTTTKTPEQGAAAGDLEVLASSSMHSTGSNHSNNNKSSPPAALRSLVLPTVSTRRSGNRGATKAAAAAAAALEAPGIDAVTHATFVQVSALLSQQGYPAVSSLLKSLMNSSKSADADAILTQLVSGIEGSATKLVSESPPWVHWNKSDMAPQLKVDPASKRLNLTGNFRGYRMARANAGVSNTGVYYYEVLVLPGPTAREILSQLPPAVRLAPSLEAQLQQQLYEEEELEQKQKQEEQSGDRMDTSNHSNAETSSSPPPNKRHKVGGHVRLGWSMRTGELQAPVGYDKWSYAIRDIGGSLIHKSQRQDSWGGEGYGFGLDDVVGCGIMLEGDNSHVRFFLNGECLGHFVISKGKRVGGVAFSIEPGCYYPAVSLYMGGSVRANFGPHWIYPPRKLPTGFPKFQPVSSVISQPVSPRDAVANCDKALKLLRKTEHQQMVQNAIEIEAKVQCDAYDKYYTSQLEFVCREREERGLSTNDIKEKLQQRLQEQQEQQQQQQQQQQESTEANE